MLKDIYTTFFRLTQDSTSPPRWYINNAGRWDYLKHGLVDFNNGAGLRMVGHETDTDYDIHNAYYVLISPLRDPVADR